MDPAGLDILVPIGILFAIAAVSGWLGRKMARRSVGGFWVMTAVGFLGAMLGMWLSGLAGLPAVFSIQVAGVEIPLLWSILGSALLVGVLSAYTGERRW